MQSRLQSLAESALNVAIGLIVALTGQWVMFPLVGIAASPRQHLHLAIGFTLLSLLRSYGLRRLFNALTARRAR